MKTSVDFLVVLLHFVLAHLPQINVFLALYTDTVLVVQFLCYPLTLHPVTWFCSNKVAVFNVAESIGCLISFASILIGLFLRG